MLDDSVLAGVVKYQNPPVNFGEQPLEWPIPLWLKHTTRLRDELAVANETIAELRQELAKERERNKGFENAATIAPAASD